MSGMPPAVTFPHGKCEVTAGCESQAIWRISLFGVQRKCCKQCKPESIIFAPFLGQQEKFFAARQRIVFYGGAVAGGKSLCLMMKFAQILVVEMRRYAEAKKAGKRYRSTAWGIYFRRTTPDLEQIKELSEHFFKAIDPSAKFNDNKGIWKFPRAGGAIFQFSHLERERDKYKHKSRAYTYIAFDELTEFSESQFDYLDTRLRTADSMLEPLLQICAASNPDGEGLIWVRERFIEVAKPEEVVSVSTTLGDGRVIVYEQVYIPAKLTDNPILMESGKYEASLMNKRPEVRDALLNGNWYVVAGAFLANIWDGQFHVCEDHAVPPGAKVFRSGDWGILSPGSIGWFYQDGDGGLTMFDHLRVQGKHVDEVAALMAGVESRYGLWDHRAGQSRLNFARNPLDSSCFGDGGMSGAPTIAKDFQKAGVRWKRARKGPGSRYNGAGQIVRRLGTTIPEAYPGATEPTERARPMLRFMRRCVSPIKTIPALRADENDPNDVDTKADDHDWDMVMYACLENPVDTPDSDEDDDPDDAEWTHPPARLRTGNSLTLGPPIR